MCEDNTPGFECSYGGLQLTLSLLIITVNAVEQHILANKAEKTSFEYFLVSLSLTDLVYGAAIFTRCLIQVGEKYDLLDLKRSKDLSYLQTLATAFAIFSSLLHITVISFDRVLATRFPLLYKVWVTRKQTLVAIACIWVLGLFLTPISVTNISNNSFVSRCSIISLSWFTLTLSAFILLLHMYAVRTVRKRINSKRQANGYLRRTVLCTVGDREIHSVVVSSLIIISFLLCKLPLAIGLIVNYRNEVFQLMLTINAILNPLIYSCETWRRRKRKKRLTFKEDQLVEFAQSEIPNLVA